MHRQLLGSATVGAAALVLAGCAGYAVDDTESTLAAAGFKVLLANTPQRIADLQRLPSHELVVTERNGHPVWLYADPTRCHCLYVGDLAEYQAFERYRVAQNIAQMNLQAANLAAMNWNWGFWGPFPPYF